MLPNMPREVQDQEYSHYSNGLIPKDGDFIADFLLSSLSPGHVKF